LSRRPFRCSPLSIWFQWTNRPYPGFTFHCSSNPNYATLLNPDDVYADLLGEDCEVPDAIVTAFDALNVAIAACREPLSWEPGDTAVDPASLADVLGEG